MSYSTTLEDKIEDIVHQWDSLEKKKMFGGICYLINGNMCFGVWKDYPIVRMGSDLAAEKLKHDHVRQFDITGKPMKDWLHEARSNHCDDSTCGYISGASAEAHFSG